MKKLTMALTLVAALSLSGCAGTGPAFDAAEAPSSKSKAELVIYRPSSMVGALESPATFVNGIKKCDLPTGSFFYVEAPTGKVKIEFALYGGSVKFGISAHVKAGHTYYVRVAPNTLKAIGGGFGAVGVLAADTISDDEGIYKVRLVDATAAQDELRSTKQSTSCK